MNMDELEYSLLEELTRIDALLNQQALTWYGIRKAINILNAHNQEYYPNLLAHVFNDIRTMYIDQTPIARLYPRLDHIMELALQLDQQITPVPILDEPTFKLPKEVVLEIAC
ncbi:hypothetical protein ACFOEK_14520 [Litoribrevibacter euphylliae]|uniref:Uncharacterized protein n=1 Tax=Litoribrevibacter euphylliae TaxID=1834034 RepID=A0ABV7HL55_9GAMM